MVPLRTTATYVILYIFINILYIFYIAEEAVIPGMAPEDRIEVAGSSDTGLFSFQRSEAKIPGLEESDFATMRKDASKKQKQPYSKPIPKNFVASWNENNIFDGT